MIMSSPLKERAVVDIRATAEAHSDIADDLLAIHGLSGADTVASLHDIGKATVIKVSKTGRFSLSKVGDVTADMKSVEAQATNFICAAYGKITQSCTSMTECGTPKHGRVVHHQYNSDRFHQPVMHSSKMYTEDICKLRYGRQHFKSHNQIWTQQSMVGSLTTSVFCSHEQCHLVHCRHRQILQLIRCSCQTSRCRTAA